MKLNSGFGFRAMALAVATVVTFTALAQNAVARQARVAALAGNAQYSAGGGNFTALSVGQMLRDGDIVKTGVGSHVDIDLGDNVGVLQLAPRSTLVIRKLTTNRTGADVVTETDTELKEGGLYFKVNKLSKASHFEIATPKGIAGIRGSAGYVSADGRLTMIEGLAGMAYPNGTGADTYVVRAGETIAPDDRPVRPASPQALRDIVEALRDATTHGAIRDFRPFVPVVEPFISPVLPGDDLRTRESQPID